MNDDDYGTRLLRPLATEPFGATRIDVTTAMRQGRRARRTRRWSIISGSTAVAVAGVTGSAFALNAPTAHPKPHLPPDPPLPVACTATRLAAGGAKAAVTGGDPSGTYLVGTTDPDYSPTMKQSVLVWRNGKLVSETPQTGRAAVMSDINGSGVAVGSTQEGNPLAYVYSGGKVSRLAGSGTARAINNAGTIAGTHGTEVPVGGSVPGDVPQRWAGPGAQPELMKLPPGTAGGAATDIAEDGTIAVNLNLADPDNTEQAYLWLPDGTVRAIGTPKAEHGTTERFLAAYFRSGWLYGDVQVFHPLGGASSGPSDGPSGPGGGYSSTTVSYRYHIASRTWQKLPAFKGPGSSLTMPFVSMETYIGRQVFTYPDPVTKNPDDIFLLATISDNGHTAGGRSLSGRADPSHHDDAFRWTCR